MKYTKRPEATSHHQSQNRPYISAVQYCSDPTSPWSVLFEKEEEVDTLLRFFKRIQTIADVRISSFQWMQRRYPYPFRIYSHINLIKLQDIIISELPAVEVL